MESSLVMDNKSIAPDDDQLVGVCLCAESHAHEPSQDLALGVVTIKCLHTTLEDLRRLMILTLPTIPVSFTFLTSRGWPIAKKQEPHIQVTKLLSDKLTIRIQRSYEKPKVGIKSKDGTALGFVFIDFACAVTYLRDTISKQLGQLTSGMGKGYQFVDRNGWPVTIMQEHCLTVLDIINCSTVVIQWQDFLCVDSFNGATPNLMEDIPCDSMTSIKGPKRQRLNVKQLTFQTGKDQDRVDNQIVTPSPCCKDILISYVRAEAAQHALQLKAGLTTLGYSVYLDVHEIKSGADWQDSLNYAVSNCEVFVPLITHRYGETQWTNREVKLADVLCKLIVPVSFIDGWPPKCLAIQFATTQFIPWKKQSPLVPGLIPGNGESPGPGFPLWDETELKEVAGRIGERVEAHTRQEQLVKGPSLCKKMSMLRSCPASLPEEFAELSQHREGRRLVMISLHPRQKEFGEKLRSALQDKNYEVWCTTDPINDTTMEEEAQEASDEDMFSQPYSSTQPIASCMTECDRECDIKDMMSSHAADAWVNRRDLRQHFQQKADEACIVIFVLSKDFAISHTSRMQDIKAMDYENRLDVMIQKSINQTQSAMDAGVSNEATLDQAVQELRSSVPKGVYVYIAGGTRFYNKDSETICRSIGEHLAAVRDISVVTGGFYGVGQCVAESYESRCTQTEQQPQLWHVLPHRDDRDQNSRAPQDPDGTFKSPPTGKTVFCGNSIRDRETIVSRVFDICILVEGGPGAAHEAEQFVWNDHIVVPIKSTGGAAGGKFNVPQRIFKVPVGVHDSDWEVILDSDASFQTIGESVAKIVTSLREKLKLDSPSIIEDTKPALLQKKSTVKGKKQSQKLRFAKRKHSKSFSHSQ